MKFSGKLTDFFLMHIEVNCKEARTAGWIFLIYLYYIYDPFEVIEDKHFFVLLQKDIVIYVRDFF